MFFRYEMELYREWVERFGEWWFFSAVGVHFFCGRMVKNAVAAKCVVALTNILFIFALLHTTLILYNIK